jgi:hypothetical protein
MERGLDAWISVSEYPHLTAPGDNGIEENL